MNHLLAVVLAAGQGTRMESDLPKVLVPVLGRPMIHYVLDALRRGGVTRSLVVVGYRADDVRAALAGRDDVSFAVQAEQLGTGHAVMACRDPLAAHDGPVLVVAGDSPLIQAESVRAACEIFQREQPACVVGTIHKQDPTGLGRIVRDEEGNFTGIVEQRDATEAQRRITEVNMSFYLFRGPDLLSALDRLGNDNVQQEYYITDCPGLLQSAGKQVIARDFLQPCEALSINNLAELAAVEAEMRRLGYELK